MKIKLPHNPLLAIAATLAAIFVAAVTVIVVAVAAFILGDLLSSCQRSDNGTPTPRQYAWPRADVAAPVQRTVGSGGVAFDANVANAVVDTVANGLTISYPRYHAQLYVTVADVQNANEVPARMQRMADNLGNAAIAADYDTVTPGGWHFRIIEADSPVQTPIQMIGLRDNRMILVTAFFNNIAAGVDMDSIRPFYRAVADDAVSLALSAHQ